MKNVLKIQAGKTARENIEEQGFTQDIFTAMLGASGGPKWLILSELDRYLTSHFFKDRSTPLHLLGSSVGSWRFACYASKDPAEAIKIFRDSYTQFGFEYKDRPDTKVDRGLLTKLSYDMLHSFLGEDQQSYKGVIENPIYRLNIIAAKSRGLLKSESSSKLSIGLASAAFSNMVSRGSLKHFFKRTLFFTDKNSPFYGLKDLPTEYISLRSNNLVNSLMASGSIPLATTGIKDIDGTDKGSVYRDGGVIDYHFDLNLNLNDGLVLYPHFYDYALPGWFDKILKKRKLSPENYDRVVMISPTKEFVSKLPYGKLTDRKDFQRFDFDTRVKYWKEVIEAGKYLVDDFCEIVEKDLFMDRVIEF